MSGPKVDLETVSPNLLAALRRLGNEYGPMGVALAAASMVGEQSVVRALQRDGDVVAAGPCPDPFTLRMFHALDIADVDDLKKVLYSLTKLPPGLDGEFDYFDSNGEKIAKIWWNSEREYWMADYLGSPK